MRLHSQMQSSSICFMSEISGNNKDVVLFLEKKNPNLSDLPKHFSHLKEVIKNLDKKPGEFSVFNCVQDNLQCCLVVSYIDDEKKLNRLKITKLSEGLYSCLKKHKIKNADILVDCLSKKDSIYNLAIDILLSSYEFIAYKTKNRDEIFEVEKLNIVSSSTYANELNEKMQKEGNALLKGTFFARDCANLAPNDLYPESYANKIQDAFQGLENTKITILTKQDIQNLKMNTFLGVAQGSQKDPRVVIIEYTGNSNDNQKISYIGKGVTFDSGGISLKPANGMEEMKYDMTGSASVVGATLAAAARKSKINLVCAVGLVENMPGGNAQRPSDVVTTMKGDTVEVLNTDAEGRLVLADVMWHIQQKFNPKIMVDVATLTGAVVIALGYSYAGCFSNSKTLRKQLYQAGQLSGEEVWSLPLHEKYDEYMKSPSADIANISNKGGAAGSCTAAQFLQHFVQKEVKWAHLDIAGAASSKNGKTGFGVMLLDELTKMYQS